MSYWDLVETDRSALRKALIARESMIDRGICPPENIRILSLMKRFSMNVADMESIMKGLESWKEESTQE